MINIFFPIKCFTICSIRYTKSCFQFRTIGNSFGYCISTRSRRSKIQFYLKRIRKSIHFPYMLYIIRCKFNFPKRSIITRMFKWEKPLYCLQRKKIIFYHNRLRSLRSTPYSTKVFYQYTIFTCGYICKNIRSLFWLYNMLECLVIKTEIKRIFPTGDIYFHLRKYCRT